MKRHSFFWKLFAGNLLLMGVILFVAGLFSYYHLNANYQRQSEESQDRMAKTARLFFQRIWPKPLSEIDEECKKLGENQPMRLTVISADGRVLGDSEADPAAMENHKTADRAEVISALKGKPGRDIRTSETLGPKFRYFAEPILKDGQIVGAIRVAMPVRAIAEGEIFIRNALLLAALAAVAVAVIIAGMLSWIWNKPLRQITIVARKIARGDLSAKANIPGSDELAILASALNEMRASLALQIKTITAQREHLSVIIDNLREGIVALDKKGHVILMNAAAQGLLAAETQEAVDKHIQSVVRVPAVLDALHQTEETGQSTNRQIELETNHGLRTLDLHTAHFANSQQADIAILLVVRDITEIARTAKMKTEFVANASHELRTPLATIRAAVDSLAMVEPDDKDALDKFAGMLDRHVARLENMTKDLLDLHRAETTNRPLNIEALNFAELEAWARNTFAAVANDKGVEFIISMESAGAKFESDKTWIKLILQNLIDNAIKFTPAGGTVKCNLLIQGDWLGVKVSDTGCGIASDMQEKVFERFFQAEPSRTGDTKVRGTGLGLAIVKHATDRLGGNLNLVSEPGQGTCITIRIPQPRK